jgi:hypothetical protein
MNMLLWIGNNLMSNAPKFLCWCGHAQQLEYIEMSSYEHIESTAYIMAAWVSKATHDGSFIFNKWAVIWEFLWHDK